MPIWQTQCQESQFSINQSDNITIIPSMSTLIRLEYVTDRQGPTSASVSVLNVGRKVAETYYQPDIDFF